MREVRPVLTLLALLAIGFLFGRSSTQDAMLTRQLDEGKALYVLTCTMGDESEPQGECEARWNKALERGKK